MKPLIYTTIFMSVYVDAPLCICAQINKQESDLIDKHHIYAYTCITYMYIYIYICIVKCLSRQQVDVTQFL